MYLQTRYSENSTPKKAVCQECGSSRMRYGFGKISCTECGKEVAKPSKYKNVTQFYNGRSFDSRFEANVAASLDLRKRAHDIQDYDCQYKIELRANGKLICNYYCDFRIHNFDGTFELLEAKGGKRMESDVYRLKKKLLEILWLPEHKDYTYTVIYNS